MDVFGLRDKVIEDYKSYVRSFLTIKDERIRRLVEQEMEGGFLWPDPLVQLNPFFETGETFEKLIDSGELHPECINIFRDKSEDGAIGDPLRLYHHQVDSIRAAGAGDNYVLTTGTGSGKSLSYIVPIVNHVLRKGSGRGIQAIIVYPMNALANSQMGELEKFLRRGYPTGHEPVTFNRYTGQEKDKERKEIIANPPDILLTNYIMLELVLTRPNDYQLIRSARGLRFLVLDELHTYRGRQGADVAMLVRRIRAACEATKLLHIGTSATLAASGSWAEQQAAIADASSLLFGAEVKPERVIGERLRQATPSCDKTNQAFIDRLTQRVRSGVDPSTENTKAFSDDPLFSWIESTLGFQKEPDGDRLVRCTPRSLSGDNGAAAELANLTGVERNLCEIELRKALSHSLFIFRLHQFVSKGESVYASPEPEGFRHITLQAQQFVPGSGRSKVLLPVAFCRECGQEYYPVRRRENQDKRPAYFERSVSDYLDNDDGEAGYLYISEKEPWPEDSEEIIKKLPEDWLDNKNGQVRKGQKKNLPRKIFINETAVENEGNQIAWWFPTPFRFCLHCSVAYNPRQKSDFGKLATLGSEGRSTSTTVMTLSTIRRLRSGNLAREAKKLLSFTDNRQDASLQAGHFNDFIEIALLRSALWRAVDKAGKEGIRHDRITLRVFEAANLPVELYAADPGVKYKAREETDFALREILGYYVYRDLKRGWRITSPNLEQCGLLDIDYLSLKEFCSNKNEWKHTHPILADAKTEDRKEICQALLDFMRRELAIRVNYLNSKHHDTIKQKSSQRLTAPWALDDNEQLEVGRIVLPRPRGADKADNFVYLSPRGGFGRYLKRQKAFRNESLKLEDFTKIILQLCEQLTIPGLIHQVIKPEKEGDVGGYQLNAASLIWRPGEGSHGFHDPVRVPRKPKDGLRTNPFFTDFYRGEIDDIRNIEAHEHTAQVPSDIRKQREEKFRSADLPVLYCSPTMELGVDISELNVVNMRNIPPTPANYAQRSGRAGRSGQPAFVFSYCSAGSSHDQYFFKRPENMVAGSVTTPQLDLANEDLIRAHVHAIWLGASELPLGKSLGDVLDVKGNPPSLKILRETKEALDNLTFRRKTHCMALEALGETIGKLLEPGDKPENWLNRELAQIYNSFEHACRRWRGLYKSALDQSKRQSQIILDSSQTSRDRETAKRLRAEAEAQLNLLLEKSESSHSDFYSYRYFASEGFLPGYNFPRLPLSAFLPGRRQQRGVDEFLTRPRFLAISEFGPRSFIYHEGSRYLINKVILPVEDESHSFKRRAAQCEACGYIHPLEDEPGPDLCVHCKSKRLKAYDKLFRMQNVATRRRSRINSDEEERFRLGYELKTGFRFAVRESASAPSAKLISKDDDLLATLVYGHAATLWRMNLGWRRRKDKGETGYLLDTKRGYWAKSQVADEDPEDPLSPCSERVVPYVEDTRNCIIIQPEEKLNGIQMASLEAALKTAIQVHFQLEDRELATEALPSSDDRRYILLYEASEGGAGVLRRLAEDADALPAIARRAMEICHFDPETAEDRRRAKDAREDCEAACYDCLLSYYNQRDHRLLDRHYLPDILKQWMRASVQASPVIAREDQFKRLLNLCQSNLERNWVEKVKEMKLRLPEEGQSIVEDCGVRPDFLYRDKGTAIFIDGPHHDTAEVKAKDEKQQELLENSGFIVIRFHHAADWEPILSRYPDLFGKPAVSAGSDAPPAYEFDPEDFDPSWHTVMKQLAETEGILLEPGDEVMDKERVVDLDLATIRKGKRLIRLVDDAKSTTVAMVNALAEQGHRVLRVRADEKNVMARILAELEEI